MAGVQQLTESDESQYSGTAVAPPTSAASISLDAHSGDPSMDAIGEKMEERGMNARHSAQSSDAAMVVDERAPGTASIELQPISIETLSDAIFADLIIAQDNQQGHDVRAGRWNVTARVAKLVVALAAALSSISLIGDNGALTAVLSILTAAVAALNAAYDPPTAGELHRRAAKEYSAVVRDLDLLHRRLPGRFGYHGDTEDAHVHIGHDELMAAYHAYLDLRAKLQEVDDGAPALNRLRRADREQKVGMLKYFREKRRMKWYLMLEEARTKYNQAIDEL